MAEEKKKPTGMIIDGVIGSEAIDSSGEVLRIEGADISDVDKGTMLLNWEHSTAKDSPKALVGVVTAAKKIYSETDCENERQLMYWKQVKIPFIYGVMRLYDGAGHEGAKAIAAIIRDHAANGEMVVCRFSVDGATLKQKDNVLEETMIRQVAVTVKPCNRTANSGVLEDPNAPEGFEKVHVKNSKDLLDFGSTEKSEGGFGLQRLGGTEYEANPLLDDSAHLSKAMEAGIPSGAPSTRTQGAALQVEDLGAGGKKPKSLMEKAMGFLEKYAEPFEKESFEAAAKNELPEASDEFIKHFTDIASEFHLKRSQLSKSSQLESLVRTDALILGLRKAIDELGEGPSGIPAVYAVYITHNDGHEGRAGRVAMLNGSLYHLEDDFGLLDQLLPAGQMNQRTLATLQGMGEHPRLRIVREHPEPEAQPEQPQDVASPDLALGGMDASMAPPAPPPSVFLYQRVGMEKPHTLEVVDGQYLLDGSLLSYPEVQNILANVRNRTASIRYKSSGEKTMNAMQKSETILSKNAPEGDEFDLPSPDEEHLSPQDLLRQMRATHGHDHPMVRAMTRHVYVDPMTGLGNKLASEEFKAKNRPGAYVMMDGTDFSNVNNAFGHKVGDEAIKSYGSAVRAAMKEAAPGVGKAFRMGGDETLVHFPTHEHAAHFARTLHRHLNALPPVQGVHKLSAGIGIGPSPEHADKALYAAKEQKYLPGQEHIPARSRQRAFPMGQAPNMAHSLMPGHEGPIPLEGSASDAISQHVPKPSQA